MSVTPLVELKGIVKKFHNVLANDHVDFSLMPGEVHALLGENAAGKTTLMNILYGLYSPDDGEIYVKGKKVRTKSPADSIKLGIGMVHQNFKLIPVHTVWENVVLGLKEAGFILNKRKLAETVRKVCEEYGWNINPNAKVWQLSVSEKQQVELLKLLIRNAEVLILDEPTSVLTPQETKNLFKALRIMAKKGKGIIFITHKLEEVFGVSDRVTVMRKGKVIATKPTSGVTAEELANLMIGRPVLFRFKKSDVKKGNIVLETRDLKAMGDRGVLALDGINLRVHSGEILGIAGIAGNGQEELMEVLAGLRRASSGKVFVDGEDVTNKGVSYLREKGVVYIPPESTRWAIIRDMNLMENIALKLYRSRNFSGMFTIDWSKLYEFSKKLIEDYEIAAHSPLTLAGTLSGGNLQKVVLARELSATQDGSVPKLILAAYPTKGLDVAATEFVQGLLLNYRSMGSAIIFLSEDLEEIMMLSDRVVVISKGGVVSEFAPTEKTIEEVGMMMVKGNAA
ncbi:MAG: ABC transporter ATP-binding protein [Nitrososphaerota archaeon]|nr:ABC transporter ATP-binding protein [Aigarchaeota archaeon]MDW8076711.1 ABC transporter ATP-binding protein [Nitrososphaerota archaeon]